MDFNSLMEDVGKAIDAVGVAAIVLGGAVAGASFLKRETIGPRLVDNYRQFRLSLGRSILLGLELLIAGDIVRTVAATPTFKSVGILVVIEEDGDLFGATVILASRIAAKADGGEILVADTVRGLCSGKGFLFADRGEFVAKGFEEPVRVYEVRWRD